MIVLNSQKEIIRVENWSDITDRPGFSANLDPTKQTLDAIIGRYAFPEKVPCGLSNCHTPHGKGYIVATKDGHETNIGKDCGKTYFGVDFETLSNKFERDMTEKENREKLWNFFFRSEETTAQVAAMRSEEHGADWVYRQAVALQESRNVTSKVARRLVLMVKARDPRMVREREATEEEAAQLEQAQGRRLPRPQYVSEPLGELVGLEALYPENDLRALLITDVSEHLKELNEVNIDELTFEQLRRWSRWLGTLDATFERAAQAVSSGRKLLTQDNLSPLAEAAGLTTEDHRQFLKFLRQYPTR
jgi:hypothetical protein